jgi:hypothetical protein
MYLSLTFLWSARLNITHHFLDFQLTLEYSYLPSTPRSLYGRCDYHVYDTLLSSDWSCVYSENYVGSAFLNLTAIVSEAINQAIPFVKYRNFSFPHWFSSSLKYYIKKKISILEDIRIPNLQNITLVFHTTEN